MKFAVGVLVLLSVVVIASARAFQDQEIFVDSLEEQERELDTQQLFNPVAAENAPIAGISKRRACGRHCIGFSFWGACLGWAIRCRRSEIPDGEELNQLKSEPSDKMAVTGAGKACLLCASVWANNVCPVCARWDKKPSSDGDKVGALDVIIVSAEEQKAAVTILEEETRTSFRNFYDKKVVKAEKYEFPAKLLGKGITSEKSVDGVVVTLADGRQLLVINGRELWKGKSSAVLTPKVMSDIWAKVESKDVQVSAVEDYVKASDSSASSKEAADKMMALE